VPQPIIAKVCSTRRIVRAIPTRAIVGIARDGLLKLGGERASDEGARSESGDAPAVKATVATIVASAAMVAAIHAVPAILTAIRVRGISRGAIITRTRACYLRRRNSRRSDDHRGRKGRQNEALHGSYSA